ncbi:hypothetical protein [endosymbiont 'TC1' of Trimyema compressum]|nr:hypothetical protein [endosymbiont 'TC1' of Trimyema compressum]
MANIPLLGGSFLGLISILSVREKEYHFSTYDGGKVESIVRKNGKLT